MNLPITYVDVQSPMMGQYQKYFKGNSIPFTVLLDGSGKPVYDFSGGRDLTSLERELKSHMK